MNNIRIFCGWDLKFNLQHEKQIELYVDQVPSTPTPPNTVRFVFLLEPPEIKNIGPQALNGLNTGRYNYLLTHNQELINASDKAHLFEFATSWVKNYHFPEKKYEVSALVGGKNMAPGHGLRTQLLKREVSITKPKKIFVSGNFPPRDMDIKRFSVLGKDKSPLFDSQFHICIENAKRPNWFTEKLIDCLITKTVPIYWGCPNIGNWFNLKGFIIVDSVNEIISAANSITPELYNEMLPYIEENYEKAIPLSTIEDRLINKMLELVNG